MVVIQMKGVQFTGAHLSNFLLGVQQFLWRSQEAALGVFAPAQSDVELTSGDVRVQLGMICQGGEMSAGAQSSVSVGDLLVAGELLAHGLRLVQAHS